MILGSDSWPGLKELEENWEAIKAEFDAMKPEIFQATYYGRKVLDLKYYSYTNPLIDQAPLTKKLCENIPGILGWSFCYLPDKGFVTPHLDHDLGDVGIMSANLCLQGEGETGLSVGDQYIYFQSGKVTVHDGNKTHHGWNFSGHDRCTLAIMYATKPVDVDKSEIIKLTIDILKGIRSVERTENGEITDEAVLTEMKEYFNAKL
jgi:hypothetical protein